MAASTLLRLLKPRLLSLCERLGGIKQIFPHRDVDMWGRVLMSRFRGDFSLCSFRDLIYARTACSTPNRKQNLKSHHMTPLKFLVFLKLQSVSFASLSPSLFENLELQLLAELSSLRGVVSWHSFSADESNVLRWMCSCQSPHRCGCLLYFAITDSSLCLGNMTQIRIFTVYCHLNK